MAEELNDFEKEEDDTFYEDDFEQQPPPDVIAYNELRSCADLVRMYEEDTLEIQPEFQREAVWKPAEQTRFIDSMIKQLPIPSMCFSLDYKTQKWQVIDGLQRMSSTIRFLTDKNWRLSSLEDIDKKISGVKVSEFTKEDSPLAVYYKRVQNLSLPITVLRCDYTKNSHMEYLFTIFHRLNSGGTKLNNQEIRNCIFSGPFNDLLKYLNENQNWRNIHRLKDQESYRFKHVELILRYFAFFENKDKYKGTLSKFLNEYMKKNRKPSEDVLTHKKDIFERTVSAIWNNVFDEEDTKLGNSALEALMHGISKNIDHVEGLPKEELRVKFANLLDHESLNTAYLSGGVAKKDKVDARLEASEGIFGI